jgi:shikimate 5-dehydrogenase
VLLYLFDDDNTTIKKREVNNVKNMLVLGAGKFGRRTVETLIEAGCRVTVVDRDATALKPLSGANLTAVCAEGIEYLAEEDIYKFDFIIPALPLHVAFEWVIVCLNKMGISSGHVSVPE